MRQLFMFSVCVDVRDMLCTLCIGIYKGTSYRELRAVLLMASLSSPLCKCGMQTHTHTQMHTKVFYCP